METNLIPSEQYPVNPDTGLTLPLSKFLGSQELAKHRAMVAFEMEVLAKKLDRFGWDRDRGTAAQDRLITDWMDALQDYPLWEVREACKSAIMDKPNRMPNEGDVKKLIISQRRSAVIKTLQPEPERKRISADMAQEILQEAGFSPKRISQ